MNIRILKKDLRRKKSINLILLLFIFLSVTFVTGSLNNFSIIQNGLDEFMEKSHLGDFTILTLDRGQEEVSEQNREVENFLKGQEEVSNYFVDDVRYLTKKQTKRSNGTNLEQSETIKLKSVSKKGQKFFQ